MSNEISITKQNLPANIEDLSKFILIGREKLVAVRAEIRAIKKVGLAEEVRRQKLEEAQDIADAVLDAEVKIGELIAQIQKASGGDRRSENFKNNSGVIFENERTKTEAIINAGLTPMQVSRFQTLAKHPAEVEKAKADARQNDDIVSRSLVLNMIKSKEKKEEIQRAEQSIAEQAEQLYKPILHIGDGTTASVGKYDLLLTDPPYSTDIDDIESFVDSWLFRALDNVKDTGFAYIFIGAYPKEVQAYLNARIPQHMKLEQVLVWTYKNTLGNKPKDRYKLNYQICLFYRGVNAPSLDCPLTNEQWAVQEINAPDGRQGDRYHAWQKPLEIAERFIRHSTKQGDTVFDPFACTGTFLLAGAKLGRRTIGYEINPDHAKIAFESGVKRRTYE